MGELSAMMGEEATPETPLRARRALLKRLADRFRAVAAIEHLSS
jgi:hypothetical protein